MTASTRLAGYLAIGAGALVLGLLAGRPEPVVVGAPFLLLAALALTGVDRPHFTVAVELDRERAVEGELVTARVAVSSSARAEGARLDLRTPRGLAVETPPAGLVFGVAAGGRHELAVQLRCRRWGGYSVGEGRIRCGDRFGIFQFDQAFDLRANHQLRVYPRAEELRAALRPLETQVFAGNQVSRRTGEGIEFADIRAFVPGDVVRRVNWRVSARRGELHVNEHHLERNSDVVIFLDTFSELRVAGESTLDLAVRGAAAVVARHLAGRDRVGLVSFGGTLRWLRPAMGQVQLYRLVDSLIDTEIHASFAWKGIEVIPTRILPPHSLVVALSPLLDERSLAALADLRARGHDVAIVEVRAESFVAPGRSEPEQLAYRLWQMEREAARGRFRELGVPVATWARDGSLQGALEEVRGFRRAARVARV